jgi:hypothetical protein
MKLSLRIAALILMAATLTGCAAKPAPPPVVDLTTMQCNESPVLGGAVLLAFDPKDDKQTPVLLDNSAGCLSGPNGSRMLYKVFELPHTGTPYILHVTAAPWANTILAPRAALLDESGIAKRTTSHADFTFRGNSLAAFLRSHDDERYLVVSSDPEVLGTSVTRINEGINQQMVAAGPVFMNYYSGSDTATNLILSAAGNAVIVISPLPAK